MVVVRVVVVVMVVVSGWVGVYCGVSGSGRIVVGKDSRCVVCGSTAEAREFVAPYSGNPMTTWYAPSS